ncbi:MAG TPA: YfbM family protein [Terriglobia bacterium]|nr:YfbM family protein [Terriglobia bacterium]
MGMYLELIPLSNENISKVLQDPPLVWKVVAPDDPEPYETARKEASSAGFFSKLFGGRRPPDPALTLSDGEGDSASLSLDKAWHGIHYMLTRSAWEGEEPLNFLVSGGKEVGDLEVGYGPARVFTPDQVQRIHSALRPLDEAFLRGRFNPTEMMKLEIYPEIWDRDPSDDDTFGYCMENFTGLKDFIETAAGRKIGLLVCIL